MDTLKKFEHKFKNFWFVSTSVLLKRKRALTSSIAGAGVHKALLLPPGRIGDMISALPVADGLLKNFPDIKLSILASPANVTVVREDPRFANVYLYQKRLGKDIKTLRAIRHEKFDCVIDLMCDDSVTGLYLSQLCVPGKPRIGIGKTRFAQYYDFAYPRTDDHILDIVIRALEAFGIDSNKISRYAPPYVDAVAKQRAVNFLESTLPSHCPNTPVWIGYNLSAGAPTRLWALVRVKELLQRALVKYPDCQILLICIEEDRHHAEALANELGERVVVVPAGLTITEASAFISRLDLLITPDTSLVHIARSFQIPVVGLYTRCQWNLDMWRPYGQKIGTVLSGHEGHIFDIQVDQVYKALIEVFNMRVSVLR